MFWKRGAAFTVCHCQLEGRQFLSGKESYQPEVRCNGCPQSRLEAEMRVVPGLRENKPNTSSLSTLPLMWFSAKDPQVQSGQFKSKNKWYYLLECYSFSKAFRSAALWKQVSTVEPRAELVRLGPPAADFTSRGKEERLKLENISGPPPPLFLKRYFFFFFFKP